MNTQHKQIIIPDYMIFLKFLEKDGRCLYDIFLDSKITYKHLHDIKKSFIKLKWITLKKVGARHNIYLTDEGKKTLKIVNKLLTLLNITDEDIKHFLKKSKIKKREKVDLEKLKKEVEDFDNAKNK